jgi:hypothetical protein
LAPFDPIEHVRAAAPARILFQFGRNDFYIAPMTGREFARAAGEIAELKAYHSEHEMTLPEIAVDRAVFLERELSVN